MQLQRITSGSRWIPEIDGLRFIAIMSVLLVHLMDQTVTRDLRYVITSSNYHSFFVTMNHLGRGVQVFFVISGFILAQPFLRQFIDNASSVNLKKYYWRRVTRLEPPYMICLLLYAASLILFRHRNPAVVIKSLLTSVFYIHNFFHWLPPVNFVTWTLEIEIQFYLLAPLLALVFLIRPAWFRRSVLAAAILVDTLLSFHTFHKIGFFFPEQICFFLVGFLLADFQIHKVRVRGFGWDLASIALWAGAFLLPEFRLTRFFLSILLFMCFGASMMAPWMRKFLSLRWVALTGGMCYSLYLMHMIIISAVFPLTRKALVFSNFYLNYITEIALTLPLILIGCTLFYVTIERPCMNPNWPSELAQKILRFRAFTSSTPQSEFSKKTSLQPEAEPEPEK